LDGAVGIYQANKLVNNAFSVVLVNGNFGDAFLVVLSTSGFYV
jgi:hypothetical protein